MADTNAELEVMKKMAELMSTLGDDSKRRAITYLADLAGLTQRSQPQAMPMHMPASQMHRGGMPPEMRAVAQAAANRAPAAPNQPAQ